jgi:hypothetical protein
MRSFARYAVLSLTAFATSASAQPAIVKCKIKPSTAWQTAKSRGWQVNCSIGPNLGNPTLTADFEFYSMGRIGCRFYSGLGGIFPKSAQAVFFIKPANLPGGLRNGWLLSYYDVSGLWSKASVSTQALIVRDAPNIAAAQSVYHLYLNEIELKKTAGSCASAVQEAF